MWCKLNNVQRRMPSHLCLPLDHHLTQHAGVHTEDWSKHHRWAPVTARRGREERACVGDLKLPASAPSMRNCASRIKSPTLLSLTCWTTFTLINLLDCIHASFQPLMLFPRRNPPCQAAQGMKTGFHCKCPELRLSLGSNRSTRFQTIKCVREAGARAQRSFWLCHLHVFWEAYTCQKGFTLSCSNPISMMGMSPTDADCLQIKS